MNLLLPSVGRKVSLARMFREALAPRGASLVAADLSPLASGLYAADRSVLLPRFDAEDFWPRVAALKSSLGVGAVVPARDAELAGWAKKAREGALPLEVVLSPLETLTLCRDKLALADHARRVGVFCPWTEDATLVGHGCREWPMILKPRRGAGSRGLRVVASARALAEEVAHLTDEYVVQEMLHGPEFTLDAYVDKGGATRAVVARRRISVQNGQTDVGETVEDAALCGLARRFLDSAPFRGAVNLQFIIGPEGPRLIDVNPRFSGGIAITRAAGMDFADWTVRELWGEPLDVPKTYRLITYLGHAEGIVVPSDRLAGG